MLTLNDKQKIINNLLEVARQKELEIRHAYKEAQERANEAEGAMQSRYDTFKEEAQYLAGGLKRRHLELEKAVTKISSFISGMRIKEDEIIQLYSVVGLKFNDEEEEKLFIIAPVLGGECIDHKVNGEIKRIHVITHQAPLGQLLIGKEEGDEVEIKVGNKKRQAEIVFVI